MRFSPWQYRGTFTEALVASAVCEPGDGPRQQALLTHHMRTAEGQQQSGQQQLSDVGLKSRFIRRLLGLPAMLVASSGPQGCPPSRMKAVVKQISAVLVKQWESIRSHIERSWQSDVSVLPAIYHVLTVGDASVTRSIDLVHTLAAADPQGEESQLLTLLRQPLLDLLDQLQHSPGYIAHVYWPGDRNRTRTTLLKLLERAIRLASILHAPSASLIPARAQLARLKTEQARMAAQAAQAAADEEKAAAERQRLAVELGIEIASPSEFVCPITQECMRQPAVASDGNSYERSALLTLLQQPLPMRRSPLTREPLESTIYPNHNLRRRIKEHQAEVMACARDAHKHGVEAGRQLEKQEAAARVKPATQKAAARGAAQQEVAGSAGRGGVRGGGGSSSSGASSGEGGGASSASASAATNHGGGSKRRRPVTNSQAFSAGRCSSTQCTLGAGHEGLCSHERVNGKRRR